MSKFELIDSIPESVKKSMEISDKIANRVQPIIEQNERISELTHPLEEISTRCKNIIAPLELSTAKISDIQKSFIPRQISASSAAMDMIGSSLKITALRMASLCYEMPTMRVLESISQAISSSMVLSVQNVLTNFSSAFLESVQSPFLQWLKGFDFSPWSRIFDACKNLKFLNYRNELDEIYLRAMYEAKWFPYAVWMADIELVVAVNDILNSSRGMSKRCEKRIDKAILSYYTKKEIKRIKKEWNASELVHHIKRTLGQALEAYLRGEYALVIPCLATMWEGIIKSKIAKSTQTFKEGFKKLVDENGFDDVFSDFYNNLIIGTCYSKDEVIEGVPNRHSVAHSWYIKYPTKKAALNAILLTDFVINLKQTDKKEISKDQTEDDNNGQTDNANGEQS